MSIESQLQIRENAQELQDFIKDIESWEDDIKLKDQKLSNKENISEINSIPPVRPKRKKKKLDKSVAPKVTTAASTDYSRWDKFDVDKALEEVDHETEEEEDTEESDNEEDKQDLKEKGNALFKACKYVEAVEAYSSGLLRFPSDPTLLANRALGLIKLERLASALEDLDAALQLDPSYVKARFRRASVRLQQGDLCEALRDIDQALQTEPSNSAAQGLRKKILKALKEDTVLSKVEVKTVEDFPPEDPGWRQI